jgi:predicted RNA binding protein YcfA (HicA-like mRNA interferase family)
MGKREKLLAKALRNPGGMRFADFETLLHQCGWVFDHQTGSHRIWVSPEGHRLPIQERKDGKAKGYQVRQFLDQWERESHEDEER